MALPPALYSANAYCIPEGAQSKLGVSTADVQPPHVPGLGAFEVSLRRYGR